MAAIPGFTTASAAASPGAETRVGAFNAFGEVLVGPPQHITAGQRLGEVAPRPGFVVATGVAANTAARACSFAPANPMRWAGEYSEGAGGVHLRARQYDTGTGRFGTPDPAGAVTPGATYTYADNNPLTKNDPLGLWPDWSADDIKNVSTKVSTYAGGAALVLGVTGIGAPVAAVLGTVAVGAGAVTAAASAYQAWDTCTNGAKGSCGDAIVTARHRHRPRPTRCEHGWSRAFTSQKRRKDRITRPEQGRRDLLELVHS